MKIWITKWTLDRYAAPSVVVVVDVNKEDIQRCTDGIAISGTYLTPYLPEHRRVKVLHLLHGEWYAAEEDAHAAIRSTLKTRRDDARRKLVAADRALKKFDEEGMRIAETREERRRRRGPRPERKPSGCPVPRSNGTPCTLRVLASGYCNVHERLAAYGMVPR